MTLLRRKDEKLDAMKRVHLFARCSRGELEMLSREMDELAVEAGRRLIEEGRPGQSFYVLLEGEARVSIKGRSRATLRTGDFFGEISMLDRGPATATVTTTAPCTLMVLSHQQFRDAIRNRQQIAVKVVEAMADRLRQNQAAGF